jgi:hypothetical protein
MTDAITKVKKLEIQNKISQHSFVPQKSYMIKSTMVAKPSFEGFPTASTVAFLGRDAA